MLREPPVSALDAVTSKVSLSWPQVQTFDQTSVHKHCSSWIFVDHFYWEQIISPFLEMRWFLMGPHFVETLINRMCVHVTLWCSQGRVSSRFKNAVRFINIKTGWDSRRFAVRTPHCAPNKKEKQRAISCVFLQKYLHYVACSVNKAPNAARRYLAGTCLLLQASAYTQPETAPRPSRQSELPRWPNWFDFKCCSWCSF